MCAPDQQDENFQLCEKKYPITLFDQLGENLGARMFNGIVAALRQYKYCIVIGTDAPALDAQKIKQVIGVLQSGTDVVFVPAEDGGYVLVAMRQAYPFLFEDISWGSAQVMRQSENRLDENNVSYEVLAQCWDVDTLKDYQRYLAFIKS